VVVYSRKLDECKERSFESQIGRQEEDRLKREAAAFMQTSYHCEADAKQTICDFEQAHKSRWWSSAWTVQTVTSPMKRAGRRRPRKGEEPVLVKRYVPMLEQITRKEEEVEAHRRRFSRFVLISNTTTDQYDALALLRHYKVTCRARLIRQRVAYFTLAVLWQWTSVHRLSPSGEKSIKSTLLPVT
jgi:hypothetical protein